ncbi:FUSC family protein [Aeromicrobium senzhongii]|uniref:FUSC family protein n=1 Tax=Aeromicrobium senzhongii TaxID=2663859 RepID=A0ABX6SXA6_9ACTN|nr:FUSC family protein [Aeromicrobium senzhongii]MTB87773.1 FUSC family protein [Aeromicrobium senzhongii]QNL95202.1 FUSC family protein [Aeromicrobium senzhongii]
MPSSDSTALHRAWESLTAFGPHGDAHWVALRAGVSMGMPLLLLWAIGRLDLALPATFGAFTALYGRANSHRPRALMQSTAAVVLVVAVATGTVLSAAGAGEWLVVVGLAGIAAVAALASLVWAWHPPGVLFPVFAVGATAGAPVSSRDVALHLAVAVATALFALVVGAMGALTPARHRPRQHWDAPLHAALRSPRTAPEITRVTLAVALAAIVATVFGLGHAYWASVAAAAAIAGPSTRHQVLRGVHRAVGTFLGVVVAAGLLALDLGTLATILLVIVLQVGAELLIGRNYAVALMVVTPLALLMVHLGSTAPVTSLLQDRLSDTILGVVVGLAVVVAWDRALPRRR